MRRLLHQRKLVKGTLLTVLVLGGLWLANAARNSADGHPQPTARNEQAGLASAELACDTYDAVIDLIYRDAPAPSVIAEMETLDSSATDAYEQDVSWLRLLSGARALGWALDHDDATAARAGSDTLDAECRRVRDRSSG